MGAWQKKRKRNTFAKENFADFRDYFEKFRQAIYPLRSIQDRLKNQLVTIIEEKQIKEFGLLPIYLIESLHFAELENWSYSLQNRFDEFDGTVTQFFSFVRELELTMETFHRSVDFLSVFAREMARHKISKRTETEYEEFREQYNSFLNSYKGFIHKLNRDLDENIFREYFNPIQRWR